MSLDMVRHAPPPEPLPPGQHRARRQLELMLAGQHPLSLDLPSPVPLHPGAAPAGDLAAEGLRCGTCRFRAPYRPNRRDHGQCVFGDRRQVVGEAGTDVRRWWSACLNYQPADGAQ